MIEHFEIVDDRAEYRPVGRVSVSDAAQLVTAAIDLARVQRVRKLLVNATALTGFPSPSIASRYQMVHQWARAAGGLVRLAMVLRPDMIDPQKFGITVAGNAGLIAEVFATEADALAWLQNIQ